MSLVNRSIKDLLLDDLNLTFLVGAGCSVESPSCQPHSKAMMEAIIRYTCAESEIEKILDLEDLRFETLLAIIQDQFDPDLKIIDYYELCDKPNIQHYFLAEMINKGNIVLTTNFDLLIESALIELNTAKKQIVPIITGKDFLKFRDPLRLLKKKKKIIYKVHGSTKNIITKEDTRDSLINSILAIGFNKEKSDLFQLQPVKYLSLKKAMKDRSLIVMGYSGNNDLDIIPTIKVIENIQSIIWINHIEENEGKEKIYEINSEFVKSTDKLDLIDQKLVEIYKSRNTSKIYRVDINTDELIRELVQKDPEISQDIFLINPINWFKENIKEPSEFIKYIISQKIYSYYGKCEDTFRCFEKILHILDKSESLELKWKSTAIEDIEFMCKERKNYTYIIDWFQKTKAFLDQLQDRNIKAILFNHIGLIYLKQGIYPLAFDCFKTVLEICSDFDDLKRIAESIKNIGMVYQGQLKYSEAIRFYEDALNIIEKSEVQEKKAEILNIKGVILQDEPNYSKALKCFEKALAIFEQKEDFEGKIISLYNIGFNNHYEGNDSKALEKLEEAMQITEQTGNLQRKVQCLKAMGYIYRDQWDLLKAIKKFKEALEIADQLEYPEEQIDILLGKLEIKADCLYNIAVVFFEERNHKEALKWFEEALEIDELIENSVGKAQRLVSIGNIHKIEGEYDKALEKFKEALKIDSLSEKAKIMRMIGMIYQKQENFEEALTQFDKAFQIFNHLDDLTG
ncbi:MAG: tetratricopeptide repeat protein, partial [Promethearchaeota archaeon]